MDLEIAELVEYVYGSDMLVRFTVSALALVTYDYIMTAETEIKYVWRVKLNAGSVLFLAIRYLPFMDLPLIIWDQLTMSSAEGVCSVVIDWYQFSAVLAVALSDAVIGLRTWAIYSRNTMCGVLVLAGWIGVTASSLYYQVLALKEDTYMATPPGVGLRGCIFVTSDYQSLSNVYTIYAVYESLIFLATIVRGVGHLRNSPAKLTSILYRDAFISSFCLFALAIINIVLLHTTPLWAYALTSMYRAMNAVLPERIILNARETTLSLDGWDVTTTDYRPGRMNLGTIGSGGPAVHSGA